MPMQTASLASKDDFQKLLAFTRFLRANGSTASIRDGSCLPVASSPAIRRSITGESSSTSRGSPRRSWREASSVIAPTIAYASYRVGNRAISPRRASSAFSAVTLESACGAH